MFIFRSPYPIRTTWCSLLSNGSSLIPDFHSHRILIRFILSRSYFIFHNATWCSLLSNGSSLIPVFYSHRIIFRFILSRSYFIFHKATFCSLLSNGSSLIPVFYSHRIFFRFILSRSYFIFHKATLCSLLSNASLSVPVYLIGFSLVSFCHALILKPGPHCFSPPFKLFFSFTPIYTTDGERWLLKNKKV